MKKLSILTVVLFICILASAQEEKAKSSFNHSKGFYSNIELYGAKGVNVLRSGEVGLEFALGYRLAPQFAVGLGGGLIANSDEGIINVPIFTQFRCDLLDRAVSPYIMMNAGIQVNPLDYGLYNLVQGIAEPSVGVSMNVRKSLRVNFGVVVKLILQPESYYYCGNTGYALGHGDGDEHWSRRHKSKDYTFDPACPTCVWNSVVPTFVGMKMGISF